MLNCYVFELAIFDQSLCVSKGNNHTQKFLTGLVQIVQKREAVIPKLKPMYLHCRKKETTFTFNKTLDMFEYS